ncbi:deoxyribonuclease HsdR [Clostridium sp. DMHC 10]|uniref:S1C family serine protease n=1 Tax=Clostridium sp. DMHC 10 TaxID=747377 RepID=UPI00069F3E97|nr:trypsin-like peptidase domain-containing protein [Clostridium sp. DMHC 10]KOF57349.1 deoxyribonuclease HsdR [Clostridium sp. DMHC 10]
MDNFNDDSNNMPEELKINNDFIPPQKPKRRNKFTSYIIVGLACSIIGGTISTAGALYLLPNSSAFKNTPLYKSLAQNAGASYTDTSSSTIKATNTSTVASQSGTLTGAQIVKKVAPAVVGVSTKTKVSSSDYGDVFGSYGNGSNSGTSEQDGMGSGIIFNSEGYILTNYHVIDGADTITVIFNNKKQVSAKVVNYDSSMDLAVIKITDKDVKVPGVAELGSSSSMNVGDPVYAIGNPLGQDLLGSVTTGVISALNRQISVDGTSNKQTYIQTDAAINPGNSGGPLVNAQGQVIGINSAKIGSSSSSETSVEGIGFSIPIDLVKPKISSLSKQILMLGIITESYSESQLKAHGLPAGIYVAQVQDFSSAQKAGIQAGDVITKFDGKKVTSVDDLNSIKAKHNAGDIVKVEIYRNDSTKTISLTLSN